jgi:hypothetical protein
MSSVQPAAADRAGQRRGGGDGEKFRTSPPSLLGSHGVAPAFAYAPLRLAAPKRKRRRVAEPEGFEPSIGLYNPITV